MLANYRGKDDETWEPEGDHGKHLLMTTLSSQEWDSHEAVEEETEEMKLSFFRQMPQVASTPLPDWNFFQ